ncbi:MAG TPA: hypothetical protein VM425_15615 [Myxococcota bacterium]|nr:hypothetical protein [Myxococcota bacterium]
MKRLILTLVLGMTLVPGLSGVANAQEEGTAAAAEEQIVYKKTTIIDFSDVTITGELTKPEGSYLMNKKKANFNLLIRVRDNFLPEMLMTVDNL